MTYPSILRLNIQARKKQCCYREQNTFWLMQIRVIYHSLSKRCIFFSIIMLRIPMGLESMDDAVTNINCCMLIYYYKNIYNWRNTFSDSESVGPEIAICTYMSIKWGGKKTHRNWNRIVKQISKPTEHRHI